MPTRTAPTGRERRRSEGALHHRHALRRSTWAAKAPSRRTCSRAERALTPVFADLNRYEATTHFNGQSRVKIDGDRATGESYTIAHHLFSEVRQPQDDDRLAPVP